MNRQYNVGYYADDNTLHVCFKTPTDLAGAVKRTEQRTRFVRYDSEDSNHYTFVVCRDLPDGSMPKGDISAWRPCLEDSVTRRLLERAAEWDSIHLVVCPVFS
jgi:hypothetical protein